MDLRYCGGLVARILPVVAAGLVAAAALAACVPVGQPAGPGLVASGAPPAGAGAPVSDGEGVSQRFADPRAGGVWLDACYTASASCIPEVNLDAFCQEQGYDLAIEGGADPVDAGTYHYGDQTICTGQDGVQCYRVTGVTCYRRT